MPESCRYASCIAVWIFLFLAIFWVLLVDRTKICLIWSLQSTICSTTWMESYLRFWISVAISLRNSYDGKKTSLSLADIADWSASFFLICLIHSSLAWIALVTAWIWALPPFRSIISLCRIWFITSKLSSWAASIKRVLWFKGVGSVPFALWFQISNI